MIVLALELRCWELVFFDRFDGQVHSAAAFFADAHPSHERGHGLIARARGGIDEALWVHKWPARIGDLDTVGEHFDHHAAASEF